MMAAAWILWPTDFPVQRAILPVLIFNNTGAGILAVLQYCNTDIAIAWIF